MLVQTTPPEYRDLVIRSVEERLNAEPRICVEAGAVFMGFNYREGIDSLVTALELDLSPLQEMCQLFKATECREAVGRLRTLLKTHFTVSGGEPLIALLSEWKDTESIPLILGRLQSEFDANSVLRITSALRYFGDKALALRAEEIAAHSPEGKALAIRKELKSWA